jgi:hypothetical protein
VSHRTIRESLGPYLEGELGIVERRAMERHLETCLECAVEVEELRSTVALLRELPDPPQPPELVRSVMHRIRAQEIGSGTGGVWDVLGSFLRGPIPAAAAACGLVVFAVLSSTTVSLELHPVVLQSPPTPLRQPPAAFARGPVLAAQTLAATSPGPARQASRLAAPRSGARPALPPMPRLELCRQLGSARPEASREAEIACRPWLSGMLTLAQYDSPGFLGRIHGLPASERDGWIEALAGFAAETGVASNVAARLRAGGDSRFLTLAERFESGAAVPALAD